jgi:hypothetical protein
LKIYSLVRLSKVEILIYVQQDATLHSLFYLETASHVSGGTTTHHQEHKQLYLQRLVFVLTVTATYCLTQVKNKLTQQILNVNFQCQIQSKSVE